MVFFNSSFFCTIVPEILIFVTVFKRMPFRDYWADLDIFLCFGKFMVHIFRKSYFRETTPDDLVWKGKAKGRVRKAVTMGLQQCHHGLYDFNNVIT